MAWSRHILPFVLRVRRSARSIRTLVFYFTPALVCQSFIINLGPTQGEFQCRATDVDKAAFICHWEQPSVHRQRQRGQLLSIPHSAKRFGTADWDQRSLVEAGAMPEKTSVHEKNLLASDTACTNFGTLRSFPYTWLH